MGNISLKVEAFRQIGVWVYHCETSLSSQCKNYFKCASYLLRTLYASKSGSLFKTVARSTWLWALLRWGKQGKKLTGRPKRWKGHSVFIWDSQLHCDASKQSSQWVTLSTISHFILVRVQHPELFALWLLPLVPAGPPWRTWISGGLTGANWTIVGDQGQKVLLAL